MKMFYKPSKYLIYIVFTFRPGTNTNCKWSLLGVHKFYTVEEALTLLRNMSDSENESTSESENESDSSDTSEYAHEQQYQVRTNSNIQTLLPKETVNQNATNVHNLLMKQPPHQVRNMLLHPQKYLKSKKYLQSLKQLYQNWLLKKCNTPKNVSIAWWRSSGIQ